MNIQLSSIDQAPAAVTNWHLIMDDLCHPPAKRVAKVLGVTLRTVQRYNASGHAPRATLLALYWLTTWGRSQIDCQATNDARSMAGLARALTEDRDRLVARVELLETRLSEAHQLLEADPNISALLRCRPEGRTNWKVLLEPSSTTPTSWNRAEADQEGHAAAAIGNAWSLSTAEPAQGALAAPPVPPQQPASQGSPESALALSPMALCEGRNTGVDGAQGASVDLRTVEHAANDADAPGSLPLAGMTDARPGTPASATGLRPSLGLCPSPRPSRLAGPARRALP